MKVARVLATLLATVALSLPVGQAQDTGLQRAIGVAASHPALAPGLARYPGWTADGYDSRGRYGLWRVDFQTASGDQLAWAQVRLEDDTVTAWEVWFELDDAEYERAQEALLEFLRHDQGFREFAGDPDEHDWSWVGHTNDTDLWTIYLERGVDSLQVTLRSRGGAPGSLDDLEIVQIEAPYVGPTTEQRARLEADAVALAFTDPSVTGALQDVSGWTAAASNSAGTEWLVRFQAGSDELLRVLVDLSSWRVVSVD